MITTELPAQEVGEKLHLSQLPNEIERQTSRIQPKTLIAAAAVSVGLSLTLKILGRRHDALFVGQWAPTLLLLGVYNKLSKSALERGFERTIDS